MVYCRHQLVPNEELGSLYDLLIDDPPDVRRAIGALVYDHLIAQNFNNSQSRSTGFFFFFFVTVSDASDFSNHLFKLRNAFFVLLQAVAVILLKFILVECCRY